jgi:hypothetical protein
VQAQEDAGDKKKDVRVENEKGGKEDKGGKKGGKGDVKKDDDDDDVPQTPEEVARIRDIESGCHACASPCDEHLWLNDALQAKVVTVVSHYCYTVVTLLLHCCYTIVTVLLHCCYSVVTLFVTL